ncbi:MAG: MucR family transcriptional regulator [Rhizobiaceae bacterium]
MLCIVKPSKRRSMADRREAMQQEELVEIVADIVSAYVSKNPVQSTDLPDLISSVHGTVAALALGNDAAQAEPQTPAVSVKSSVKKDSITCLECGKKFKSLKRHLSGSHDMTPDEYRAKWDLPASYPMVAPNYSAERSEMALKLGLGRKPKSAKKSSGRKVR